MIGAALTPSNWAKGHGHSHSSRSHESKRCATCARDSHGRIKRSRAHGAVAYRKPD